MRTPKPPRADDSTTAGTTGDTDGNHDADGTASRLAEPGGSSGKVQSLERAITLLEATADSAPDGETATNLASRCGLNRATAWRLLSTMEQYGLVERDPLTSRYTVGFAVARMASAAGFDGLIRRSHGVLRQVSEQTGETANLAVVQQLGLTYIDEVTPRSSSAPSGSGGRRRCTPPRPGRRCWPGCRRKRWTCCWPSR